MKKNYLFLAAASALVLASCNSEADAPQNSVEDNSNDAISLTTLSPASQAGRIKKVEGTRADNEKKTRLKLFYKIAPVETAASEIWSATGIDFNSTGVYVSWHSDRQATTQAKTWGGAVDVITGWPNNLSFAETLVSDSAKFNNVIADGNNLYIPATHAKKGAAIARIVLGSASEAPIRKLAGTSANSLEVKNGLIYAVSGYSEGGVFTISKDFTANGKVKVDTIVSAENFGGKYIDGDYVLRTDDKAAYIYDIENKVEYNIGAPLKSEEKYAEKYDPATGSWTLVGDKATYYGKHTMAVDDDYIYVAGGQATSGSKDGLRVIDKKTMQQVWGNATNTTAVCVDGDYVYAATGAGLRVYKKFNGKKLELFAFESVPAVDKDGNAILDSEGNQKYEAGTDAHSCNYVAVKDGYIYMANGQSGVYVFELDTTAPEQEEKPAE